MKLRNKIAALLGAGVLVLGVAGIAMAAAPGNPWQGNGYPSDSCTATTTGTMLWIFNNGGTPTDLTINGELQTGSWESKGNGSYHFTVAISGTNYPPVTASANVTGDNGQLVLSGCNEDGSSSSSSSESSSTSFTGSESGASSSSSSESSSTSFTGSESGASSVPSQPNTATIGNSGTSGSSDGWLLVAAIGALVGSLLVLTPARAKNKR